jgi:glycine/D-amino acid oxidase-like deaminating enzyme
MNDSQFASDYKSEPYWREAAPLSSTTSMTPPQRCDVAIVGSGFTGLAAAIELARGGRQVAVCDAEELGWGCSTRNGGQVSTSIKPSFAQLKARYGEATAFGVRREGLQALAWLKDFIQRERIDCDFSLCGRFHAAHNASAFDALVRQAAEQPTGLEVEVQVVPRAEQRREVGTDLYHGGLIFPAHASLHPGKFHRGLLDRARQAGAIALARCPVTAIERDGSDFRLCTPHGPIRAREVIVATNGYTGALTPWLRRRVIPIGSHIIATEPLALGLPKRLIPKNRVVTDTRKVVFYYRLSEDGCRMLFGGRVAAKEADSAANALALHRRMTQVFPELAAAKITHSWGGFIGYTFDALPHLGRNADGIHYCMGYCGSGVSLAPYFGTRLAQQLLGNAEGRTALDGLTFQTHRWYSGDPWFVPAAIAFYRLRDRLPLN